MEQSNKISASAKTKAVFILLLFYVILVLYYTVLKRSADFYVAKFELFWSYEKWLAGEWQLGWEILGNIGMFVPFGFLLTAVLSFWKKPYFMMVTVAGALFSCVIEGFQLTLMRGMFEYDDIVNNTLGAVLGYLLYKLVEKLTKKYLIKSMVLTLGNIFVLIGIGACIYDNAGNETQKPNIPRYVCFQLDTAELTGEKIYLTGFAFYCEREMKNLFLTLKSTKTGKEIKSTVLYGLQRPDVNSYFKSAHDVYTKTGFVAVVPEFYAEEEYEIFVNFGTFVSLPAGVYVTGNNIHYVKEENFVAPDVTNTDLEDIIKRGYLRVYRPDHDCYVYQFKGYLYWLAGKTFNFEENGKTYIQYQLWTTQPEKLPQNRLRNQWNWDNIGGYFEQYEITSSINCGQYRVCKRELPKKYPITSIVTGYYKNGEWIWKDYFRPLYEF